MRAIGSASISKKPTGNWFNAYAHHQMRQVLPHALLGRIKDEDIVLQKTMHIFPIRQKRKTKRAETLLTFDFNSTSEASSKSDGSCGSTFRRINDDVGKGGIYRLQTGTGCQKAIDSGKRR
jgi:hypothetical protein